MMKIKRRITSGYFDIACKKYELLIKKLSFSIGIDALHTEELQAMAKEEILKCLICYDGRCSFITFLYVRVHGAFRHSRDVENRARRIQNITMESMCDLQSKDINKDTHMMVQECLRYLTKEESEVIIDLYINEKTMREVAEEKGSVASTICRIKIRAIEKMRQQYAIGVN